MKTLTQTQKKVLILSLVIGIIYAVVTYIEQVKINYYLNLMAGIDLKYSNQKIMADLAHTFVILIGVLLHFIVDRKTKATTILSIFLFFILVSQDLILNYSWNSESDSTIAASSRFFKWTSLLPHWLLYIPRPGYIVGITYVVLYNRNFLLSLVSVFISSLIISILYTFTLYFTNILLASVMRSLFTFLAFWFILYFLTDNFKGINELIIKARNFYFREKAFPIKQYRRYFAITHFLLFLSLIVSYEYFKLNQGFFNVNFLIDLLSSSLLFILLYIFSIKILICRLKTLNLNLTYVWYNFIPGLNLYLMYLTLKKEG